MAAPDVFDADVVNNEDKHDGASFVAPEARRGGTLVVTLRCQSCSEEVVSQHARLVKAVYPFPYFKVDPVMMSECGEVVFVNEFRGDVL